MDVVNIYGVMFSRVMVSFVILVVMDRCFIVLIILGRSVLFVCF